jgi:hypothetical protein
MERDGKDSKGYSEVKGSLESPLTLKGRRGWNK